MWHYYSIQKGKNRLYLKNWTPISLLNTEYKVIAKILATRLQTILPDVINDDQSGYRKGRYIGHNVWILEVVTFFTKKKNHQVSYSQSISRKRLTPLI